MYYRPAGIHIMNHVLIDSSKVSEISPDIATLNSSSNAGGSDQKQQQQNRMNIWWNYGNSSKEDQKHHNDDDSVVGGFTFSNEEERNLTTGEWIECFDEEMKATYYYNSTTGEATWINPADKNEMH